MDLERLCAILRETTCQLRKDEERRQVGNVVVTEVFAMPHESDAKEGIAKVDCHFVVVGVDIEKAKAHRDELVAILEQYPSTERLKAGPSYIEVGGELGDQGAAFQLFALGKALDLWDVITPERLGFAGDEARMLAGSGMVMITGFREGV